MQSVGKFDDEHPNIARHGDDHFAHCFGLGSLPVLDLVELCNTVDHDGDFDAEFFAHIVKRIVGVFHNVVQQRCSERNGRHADLGENRRNCDRVRDVGIAASAHLPLVGFVSQTVRPEDHIRVELRMVFFDDLQQRGQDFRRLRAVLRARRPKSKATAESASTGT